MPVRRPVAVYGMGVALAAVADARQRELVAAGLRVVLTAAMPANAVLVGLVLVRRLLPAADAAVLFGDVVVLVKVYNVSWIDP